MSFFGKVFGGGGGARQEAVPTPQEAIQRLRETEEMLQKKTSFLEKKIADEITIAKANGTKNKRAAIAALKRKKRCEKQLQQIDGTLSTIEFQRESLENASTNTEVLTIMGMAAKSLKQAHKSLDVDQVHDLMDEIAEQQDVASEISEAISNPIGFGHDVDEDELLKELEGLEQETLDEQLLDAGKAPAVDQSIAMPNVPSAEPRTAVAAGGHSRAKAHADEDDEMKELAQWAS